MTRKRKGSSRKGMKMPVGFTGGGWNKGLTKETSEGVARSAAAHVGVPLSDEHKSKLSAKKIGVPLTDEHKAKIKAVTIGHEVSAEARAKIGASSRGRSMSLEARAKISRGRRDHLTKDPNGCRCGPHLWETGQRQTQIERILCEMLLSEFPEVRSEEKFGAYRVDAYLPPPYHLAFEADGKYWHDKHEQEDPGCYSRRDEYLMENFDLPVIRLGEEELIGMKNGR